MPRPLPFAPGPVQWRSRKATGPDFHPTGVMVEMEFSGPGGGWTEITEDVLGPPGIKIRRGIRGSGINDRVAATGTAELVLNNANNSAGLTGYYSPDHANKRSGFAVGAGVRISADHAIGAHSTRYVLFVGTIDRIRPAPGYGGVRGTAITCVDYMEELARFKVREIAAQTSKRADEILETVLAAMPRPPVSTDLDEGTDTYSFALDAPGTALAECGKLARSEQGYIFQKRDGAIRFEARTFRIRKSGSTFTPEIEALSAVRDTTRVTNFVQATARPRRSGTTATAVLATLREPVYVLPDGSVTIRMPYTDPDQSGLRVAGTDFQSLVSGTDYQMGTLPDGGLDVTSDFTVTPNTGAYEVKFVVTNNGSAGAYVNTLQQRGRVLFNLDPVTAEAEDASSIASYGERAESIDMPYQEEHAVAKAVADYTLALYKDPFTGLESITLKSSRSDAQMAAVLGLDVSSMVRVSESVTGLSKLYFINGVALELYGNLVAKATWTLAPADEDTYFTIGVSTIGGTDGIAPL